MTDALVQLNIHCSQAVTIALVCGLLSLGMERWGRNRGLTAIQHWQSLTVLTKQALCCRLA